MHGEGYFEEHFQWDILAAHLIWAWVGFYIKEPVYYIKVQAPADCVTGMYIVTMHSGHTHTVAPLCHPHYSLYLLWLYTLSTPSPGGFSPHLSLPTLAHMNST